MQTLQPAPWASQKARKEKLSWMEKCLLLEEILLRLPVPVAWACNDTWRTMCAMSRGEANPSSVWCVPFPRQGLGGGGRGRGWGEGRSKLPARRHRLSLHLTLCNAAKAASKTTPARFRSDALRSQLRHAQGEKGRHGLEKPCACILFQCFVTMLPDA